MLKRNKTGMILISIFAIIGIGSFATFAGASPSNVVSQATQLATTTVSFMTAGFATSTYQFDNGALSSGKVQTVVTIDDSSLYFSYVASSSSSTLGIQLQYSNNNIDWYGYNAPITSTIGSNGYSPLASSTITWYFTPGTTATTSQVIRLPSIPAIHERVVFTQISGNGGIYAEVDLKRQPQTP